MKVGQSIDGFIWDCPTTAHILYSGRVLPCCYDPFCHALRHLVCSMPARYIAGNAAVHAEKQYLSSASRTDEDVFCDGLAVCRKYEPGVYCSSKHQVHQLGAAK